ncbi:sensor histidine kinase [Marinifilum fragile]|uniref:sensor histidine kinase n=1 Tax=Marinifilum fragile TaxID=570161 RepID=UPI0006D26BAC|nr:sensor histidine kinase [Marinifilum fragile]
MIALMEVKSSILDFDSIVRNDQVPSQGKNLKQSVSAFTKTFANYEKALHLYIYQTNQKFKRNIFFLLAFILILLLGSLFLVIRLMNSLTNAHLQLVRNTMTVEQRERKRIARELHDGLGALLSSIGLYGKMLGKELIDNKNSLDKVRQINQLSKQALDTVSEVINNLNPSVLNRYNLQESLQRLVDKINNLDNVDVTLHVNDFKGQPLQSTQVVIYRICSELINNTLKHAKATDIQIKLSGENILVLQYSDNGVGFDLERLKTIDGKGMGLQNIIERVESINGTYQIQTSKDKGFKIKIQFALSKSNQK